MTKKVLIDPGHCLGEVNGGPTGYLEVEGMWILSNYLKKELEKRNIQADLTKKVRTDCPSLAQRGAMAKGYDLFLSNHSNGFNGTVRGASVFYSVKRPKDKAHAAALSAATSKLIGNPNRGAKTRLYPNRTDLDYYGVIRAAAATGCPHVFMAESEFHDHPVGEAWLKKDSNMRKLAEVQAIEICKILGVSSEVKPEPKPDPKPTPKPTPNPDKLKAGDKVKVKNNAKTYTGGGLSNWVYNTVFDVLQVSGNRVVIGLEGEVTAAVNEKDLILQTGTVTPPAPKPTPEKGTLYRVQTEAFHNLTDAEKMAKDLEDLGYPAYIITEESEKGEDPDLPGSDDPVPSSDKLKAGDKVKVKNKAKTYTSGNLSNWVYNTVFDVLQVSGNRVVIGLKGEVTAAVNEKDLILQTGTVTPPTPKPKALKIGSKVKVRSGASTYTGGYLQPWVYNTVFDVIQINGNRIVIGIGKVVTAAVNKRDLII